jgi:hypothetical protein
MATQVLFFDPLDAVLANGAISSADGISHSGSAKYGETGNNGNNHPLLNNVVAVVADSSGNIYVTSQGSNNARKVNAALDTQLGEYSTGTQNISTPVDLLLDEAAGELYVVSFSNDSVIVLNSADMTYKRHFLVMNAPDCITMLPNGNVLVGGDYNGTSLINEYTPTGTFVATRITALIPTTSPIRIAAHPSSGQLLVHRRASFAGVDRRRSMGWYDYLSAGATYDWVQDFSPGLHRTTLGNWDDPMPWANNDASHHWDNGWGDFFWDTVNSEWLVWLREVASQGLYRVDAAGNYTDRILRYVPESIDENLQGTFGSSRQKVFADATYIYLATGYASHVRRFDRRTGTGIHTRAMPRDATLNQVFALGHEPNKTRISYRVNGGSWTVVDMTSTADLGVNVDNKLLELRVEQNLLYGPAGIAPTNTAPAEVKLGLSWDEPGPKAIVHGLSVEAEDAAATEVSVETPIETIVTIPID